MERAVSSNLLCCAWLMTGWNCSDLCWVDDWTGALSRWVMCERGASRVAHLCGTCCEPRDLILRKVLIASQRRFLCMVLGHWLTPRNEWKSEVMPCKTKGKTKLTKSSSGRSLLVRWFVAGVDALNPLKWLTACRFWLRVLRLLTPLVPRKSSISVSEYSAETQKYKILIRKPKISTYRRPRRSLLVEICYLDSWNYLDQHCKWDTKPKY